MEAKSRVIDMSVVKKIAVMDYNCITPLGWDVQSTMHALLNNQSGIQLHHNVSTHQDFYQSLIDTDLLDQEFLKLKTEVTYSKLEKLFILALKPLIDKHSIHPKSGLIISTTKGNIDALNQSAQSSGASLTDLSKKIAAFFGFTTQPIIVSNACVSGILSLAVAKRMLQTDLYTDFYVVAGDLVSDFVLSGFNSFQALSDTPCCPYDKDRKGVTLGEAAVATYVTEMIDIQTTVFEIIGDGAVNDANHISGPSRTGEGLYQSIESAFKEAGIQKNQLDYISAHGTATLYNDEMESIAFSRSDISNVPLNSLKGYFGHTLGASGLLESVIAMECAKSDTLLASKGYKNKGVSEDIQVITNTHKKQITYFLKTASGFGGCNTAVLFKKTTQ